MSQSQEHIEYAFPFQNILRKMIHIFERKSWGLVRYSLPYNHQNVSDMYFVTI